MAPWRRRPNVFALSLRRDRLGRPEILHCSEARRGDGDRRSIIAWPKCPPPCRLKASARTGASLECSRACPVYGRKLHKFMSRHRRYVRARCQWTCSLHRPGTLRRNQPILLGARPVLSLQHVRYLDGAHDARWWPFSRHQSDRNTKRRRDHRTSSPARADGTAAEVISTFSSPKHYLFGAIRYREQPAHPEGVNEQHED